MPQIGWLEILSIVIISILVLGPKEFPIALKKIGTYIGKFKNTLTSLQKEVQDSLEDIVDEINKIALQKEFVFIDVNYSLNMVEQVSTP